jgi:diguanylate cyclase (GGDEF)-like protein
MLRPFAGGERTVISQIHRAEGSFMRQRNTPLVRPALAARLEGQARVWLLTGLIAATALATYGIAVATGLEAHADSGYALVLMLAFFATQGWVVHVHFNRESHSLSLNEVPLTLGLLAVEPGSLLLALGLGSAAALVLVRRQAPRKVAFDVAQLALSGTTAVVVFTLLAPSGTGLGVSFAAILAACCFSLVSVALVSLSLRVAESTLTLRDHLRVALLAVLSAAGTAALTIVAFRLAQADMSAALLLVVPAVLWVAAFRGYTTTRNRHEHLEFLYESMREVQSAEDFRSAAEQLLRQLSHLLRAEFAELLFLGSRSQDGHVQQFALCGSELTTNTRAIRAEERLVLIHGALSERSVLLARGHRAHPLDDYLRARGLDDAMIVPLRGEERELGAIVVGNRASHLSTFTADDCRLFETFSAHAAVLLENDHLERSLEQLTQLEGKLRHQAYHDALTGLPNREAFIEATSEALARYRTPPVILFVDLDDFKITNDSLGHAAGDELLRVAAQRVSGSLRQGDVPARLGGDEFAVLLHETTLEEAEDIARRITDKLDAPVQLDGHECSLRGSIGLAQAESSSTADTLLRDADLAMYAAKEDRTGSHTVFRPEMQHRVRTRHSLAAALSHSIERGEISVAYQPIVSLESGAVSGFEALVRWERDGHGILLPTQFLAIAEQTGMMAPIGRFVLADALMRANAWKVHDSDVGVSVNLSAAELRDATLAHEIMTQLGATGLDPSHLTIEVTEAVAMTDPEETIRLLARLRDIGARIALDDFGTGYSSLSYLEAMPVDVLKIPKELVDGLRGDKPRTVILGAIQALAESLGLGLVAEGVEEPEQLDRLRELGYPEAQGFLLARPLSPSEAEARMRRRELRVVRVDAAA